MKTLEEQIACKCIHFNGIMEKICKAGINYSDVRVSDGNGPYKFPCLKQGGECSSARWWNADQVKKRVAEIEYSCNKTVGAIASIKDHISKTKNQQGKVKCECGGELHYTVAQVNGHIWAKCDSCDISFNE
jgi:hypothetical protein